MKMCARCGSTAQDLDVSCKRCGSTKFKPCNPNTGGNMNAGTWTNMNAGANMNTGANMRANRAQAPQGMRPDMVSGMNTANHRTQPSRPQPSRPNQGSAVNQGMNNQQNNQQYVQPPVQQVNGNGMGTGMGTGINMQNQNTVNMQANPYQDPYADVVPQQDKKGLFKKGKAKQDTAVNQGYVDSQQPTSTDEATIKSWLLTLFILMIPIANLVWLFKTAFSKTVANYKKTFAVAYLIYFAIALVLSISLTAVLTFVIV